MALLGINVSDLGTVFSGIGTLIKDIRSAVTGKLTPEQQLEVEMKLLDIQSQAQIVQNQINLTEAANPNIFVSGWRPFIGWVCGFGLAYAYIIQPFLQWIVLNFGVTLTKLPDINTGELIPLLMALLGLGGLRTVEKIQGVSRN